MGNLIDQATAERATYERADTTMSIPLVDVKYVTARVAEIPLTLSYFNDACPTKGITITADFADVEVTSEADCVVNVFNNIGGEVTLTLADDWTNVSKFEL